MANTFVKLGRRASYFSDDLSGIRLNSKIKAARLEDSDLGNYRILYALLHETLVQITAEEYYSLQFNATGETSIPQFISTSTQQVLIDNSVFEKVIGPINAPPTFGLSPDWQYMIGENPNGAWFGHPGEIAVYRDGGWQFTEPDDATVAILALYPGYFYYYVGTFPEGMWKKYPLDPINIPTIDDVYTNISITQQQIIVNNQITNYNDKLFTLLQHKVVGQDLLVFPLPVQEPLRELMVFVEGTLYRRDDSPMGYSYDPSTKLITFVTPVWVGATIQILFR